MQQRKGSWETRLEIRSIINDPAAHGLAKL